MPPKPKKLQLNASQARTCQFSFQKPSFGPQQPTLTDDAPVKLPEVLMERLSVGCGKKDKLESSIYRAHQVSTNRQFNYCISLFQMWSSS